MSANSDLHSATLSRAAQVMQGELRGTDASYRGVCTDTRQLLPGQLFVAIRGPHFDGNDFVAEAAAKGAVAAVVTHPLDVAITQIVVADCQRAYGQLAAAWRARFRCPVVAVTGSNGKTTVKEMIAAILTQQFSQQGPVLATVGNLNNEIGVPQTLLGLAAEHSAAVIEAGASHPGDIAYLTEIIRPNVALVTNAGGAHLAGFGSLDAVARTKGEIFAGLAADGVAVINADDPYADLWRQLATGRAQLTFGTGPAADVRADLSALPPGQQQALQIITPQGVLSVTLPLAGRHNAMNALAATAAALALGVGLAQIQRGLELLRPVPGRMQWKQGMHGAQIIDDTYNANPVSLAAALDVLGACTSDRYLALGDMAELGEQAEELHRQAGEKARAVGVQRLYAVGENTRFTVAAFGEQGWHFPAQEQLIAQLQNDLHDNVTLLVKGSRSAHMERVVAALCEQTGVN